MNKTLETIASLRTIHGNFSEREVSEDDLRQVLEASVRAASSSARQSYSIIVLDNRETMQQLFGYRGSRALIFCVDSNRLIAAAEYLGQGYDNDHIIGFITMTIDTSLAAQTAVVAAKSLGIDSLITNGLHRNSLEKVYQTLNLPDHSCFPLITVVLGYPNQEPAYQKGRLSLEHVVHYGQYSPMDKPQVERMVAEYDDHERHLGLIDDWERQGFEHYLDWFCTKWMGKPEEERIPTGKILEFEELLTRYGFWWPIP